MSDTVNLGFEMEVVQGDALDFAADVLAVKNSPVYAGVDAQINRELAAHNLDPEKAYLKDGSFLIAERRVVRATQVLFISVADNAPFDYGWLREFGRRVLANLKEAHLNTQDLALTIHGPLLGLDEIESFRSILLGMSDAYVANQFPVGLRRITFIEFSIARALRLEDALRRFLPARESPTSPDDLIDSDTQQLTTSGRALLDETIDNMHDVVRTVMAGPDSFEPEFLKPEADESTPHVFVAMPFRDTYDDQFYLAIQPTVQEHGLLCERMDLDAFTGGITDRMFDRISTAEMVIALLDGANPNVYLEVGYAWGVRTKTVLIAHNEEALPFDVRGHRVLIYDKIYLLKQMLEAELERLLLNF